VKILIKLSGKVLESSELCLSLARQLGYLEAKGYRVLLVHGAGKQLSEYCLSRGIPVVQKAGRRVTSQPVLDSAVKVFSSVNREICSSLISSGVNAVGLSAFDGNLTSSRRRPPIEVAGYSEKIDFGCVAEIERVNPQIIHTLWNEGFTPVVSSLCADSSGRLLNINADTLAMELGAALEVTSLVSVSDVKGLYRDLDDPASLIFRITLEEARRLLSKGVIFDGMIPKIQNAVSALERGISSYHLVSGLEINCLPEALEGKEGTLISK